MLNSASDKTSAEINIYRNQISLLSSISPRGSLQADMQIDLSFIQTHLWIISGLVSLIGILNVSTDKQRGFLIVLFNTVMITVLFVRWWLGLIVWLVLQSNPWLTPLAAPMLLATLVCLWPWSRVNRRSRAVDGL